MVDPVSTIKTLLDLTTNLAERVQDRKLAIEMRDIQRLILVLQSEHFELQEARLELKLECSDLKQCLSVLEPQIAMLKKENAEAKKTISKLTEDLHKITPKSKEYKMKWGCLGLQSVPLPFHLLVLFIFRQLYMSLIHNAIWASWSGGEGAKN